MLNPIKKVKQYFAKRRKLKNDFKLMLDSRVIRSVTVEIRMFNRVEINQRGK